MGKKKKSSVNKIKETEETGGGWMMGMRGGIKNAADSVSGKKKSNVLDWILNIILALMVFYLAYKYIIVKFL